MIEVDGNARVTLRLLSKGRETGMQTTVKRKVAGNVRATCDDDGNLLCRRKKRERRKPALTSDK